MIIDRANLIEHSRLPSRAGIGRAIGRKLEIDLIVDEVAKSTTKAKITNMNVKTSAKRIATCPFSLFFPDPIVFIIRPFMTRSHTPQNRIGRNQKILKSAGNKAGQ